VELLIRINGKGNFECIDFPAERKKIDIGSYYANFSKITTHLGWKPKTGLEQGLAATLGYYTQNLEKYI